MYIPKHFEGSEAAGREIMQAHSWALLTTADEAGAPLCTHLVLQWENDGSPAESWGLGRLPPGNAAEQSRNIVAFRIKLERVETKLKLSQNRELEDRHRVIAKLEASDSQDAQATAAWMKRVLPA